jgi:hypothetical protein
MLAGKVFLESVEIHKDLALSSSSLKLNLVVNSLLYD